VPRAIGLNLVPFLMHVLEEADMGEVLDQSSTKVNAIAILKLMCGDVQHGPRASMILDQVLLVLDLVLASRRRH
jgi:hypothetical protein